MTIVGLGNTGCNIAEKFENIKDIKVLLIDADIDGEENCISIEKQSSPEEYEKNFPSIDKYYSYFDKDIYLIVGGSGKISGASLSLLKQFKDRNLNIIYIRPDRKTISAEAKLQDKLTFNVFQEYARSGLFKSCILIDNLNVEKIIGDVPIIEFYDKINNFIYSSLYSIFTLQNLKPVMNNLTQVKDISRIRTVGTFNFLNEEENLLYNVDFIDNKHYYFIINEEKLKTDNTLLKKIKDLMIEKNNNGVDSSYAIFSSKEKENYCLIDVFSKRIQI